LLGEALQVLPVIVVVIIPVTLRAPATAILVPPAMAVFPAIFAGLTQFMPPVLGLSTLRAVALNGFM